jgi:hypothetical protein
LGDVSSHWIGDSNGNKHSLNFVIQKNGMKHLFFFLLLVSMMGSSSAQKPSSFSSSAILQELKKENPLGD